MAEHGRLIDADALIKSIIQMPPNGNVFDMIHDAPTIEPEVTLEAVKEYCRKRCLCIIDSALLKKYTSGHVFDLLYNAPTIGPERKKGKWIEDAATFYKAVNEKGGGVDDDTPYFADDVACSECLALFSVIDNEADRFDFCPNCGADLREGRQDEQKG